MESHVFGYQINFFSESSRHSENHLEKNNQCYLSLEFMGQVCIWPKTYLRIDLNNSTYTEN